MNRGALALGALLVACAGCLAPPALLRAGDLDRESVQRSLSADAERVELVLDDGTKLAGWYVPADEGAPLVLSLLESGASVDARRGSRAFLVRQLADLGFASLMLDYSGVGASSGKRSTRNLARDARAMWDEALRRVDGDPERVVVRAMSLGTLAALSLVGDGARPAGVILLVPVMPDSVTTRFARSFYGRAAGWLASALFQGVVDLDPLEVIARARVNWLLVQAVDDQLTSPAERSALAAAVEAQAGRTEWLAHEHMVGSIALLSLSPCELAFLTEVLPGTRDTEARWARFLARNAERGLTQPPQGEVGTDRLRALVELAHNDDPIRLRAVAQSNLDPMSATRVRWSLARRPGDIRDFEGLACLADFDDPAGALPLELFDEIASHQDLLSMVSDEHVVKGPDLIAVVAAGVGVVEEPALSTVTFTLSSGTSISLHLDYTEVLGRLLDRGLSDADARRQLARLLLKANRHPDRLVTLADGGVRLDCRVNGTWVTLDLTAEGLQASLDAGTGNWLQTRRSQPATRP